MDEMTSAELNQYLEAIAELIEAKATTPQEAAEAVRRRVLFAPPAGTGQTFGGCRKEAVILNFGPGSICAYCDDFPAPKIGAGKTICE